MTMFPRWLPAGVADTHHLDNSFSHQALDAGSHLAPGFLKRQHRFDRTMKGLRDLAPRPAVAKPQDQPG
jgi:hypothetical protein